MYEKPTARSVEPQVAKMPPQKVRHDKFQLVEHGRREWIVELPEGVKTKDDICQNSIWENVANKVRERDRIEVFSADNTVYAVLIVTFALGSNMKVECLSHHVFDAVDEEEMENSRYVIKKLGAEKWCIIDSADGKPLRTGIASKRLAYVELEDLQKALAS